MAQKRRHWFWNLLLVITLVICLLAFAAHSRNWMRLQPHRMQLLSGVYYLEIPYTGLKEVDWEARLPDLERSSGFSAWAMEKGIFRDSLQPGRKVYFLIDDLRQQKIRLLLADSTTLYLNFSDSLETQSVYSLLKSKQEAYPGSDK